MPGAEPPPLAFSGLPAHVAHFLTQCMDRSLALTQARYLEKEEKRLPPPRLVAPNRASLWPLLLGL